MTDWARTYENLPYFLDALLTGAVMTGAEVTAGGFVAAVLLGLLFASFKTSRSRLLKAVAYAYVELFRSVPVLTQLFVIYFGLASIGIN